MAKSKYSNQPTEIDGIRFHSKKEARRYGELKLLHRAGQITALRLQPRFRLDVNRFHVCDYIADFEYRDGGKLIVEDVKGVRTPVYRLKAKLMKAIHNIEIYET